MSRPNPSNTNPCCSPIIIEGLVGRGRWDGDGTGSDQVGKLWYDHRIAVIEMDASQFGGGKERVGGLGERLCVGPSAVAIVFNSFIGNCLVGTFTQVSEGDESYNTASVVRLEVQRLDNG